MQTVTCDWVFLALQSTESATGSCWAVCSSSHMSPGCSQPEACKHCCSPAVREGALRLCAFYLSPSPTLILPIIGLLIYFLPQDADCRSIMKFSPPSHSLLVNQAWLGSKPKFRSKPTGTLVSHTSPQPNLNLELVEPALSVRNYREKSA